MKFIFLFCLAFDDFSSIQSKMDIIAKDRAKPGQRISFTSAELNAFFRAQAREIAPKAVFNTKIVLSDDQGTTSGMIDFLELNRQYNGPSNWLMDKMLQGERPVSVSVRMQSRPGQARVDVDRVEIGGAPMAGSLLDFLIQRYVKQEFPSAKVGEWFPLAHRMERIEVHPVGATVYIRK